MTHGVAMVTVNVPFVGAMAAINDAYVVRETAAPSHNKYHAGIVLIGHTFISQVNVPAICHDALVQSVHKNFHKFQV